MTRMDRGEALQIMHEISSGCGDAVLPCWVSLDRLEREDFVITLKCSLNQSTLDFLRAISTRHGLRVEVKGGKIMIGR